MRFIFLLFMFTVSTTFAQKDITEWVQDKIDGESASNINLITGEYLLAPGESVTQDVILGEIVLPTDDSSADTVRTKLLIRAYVSSGISEITVSANNGSSNTYDVSLTTENYIINSGTIDFYEGETTTITVQNTSTTNAVTFTRLVFQTSSKTSVISDVDDGILHQSNVFISNPITNGMLQLKQLPTNFVSTSLELINLEGTPILSKVITQNDASIDVSTLKAGVYLLRETQTGYAKKIVIQ